MTFDDVKTWCAIGMITIFGGIFVLESCAKYTTGNRDNFDTEKEFNIAIDDNIDSISITYVTSYNDYVGSTHQFETQDGLIVLTSARDTQLIKANNKKELYQYAKTLADNDASKIHYYDQLQGKSFILEYNFTKNYLDLMYEYDHALIENENGITIVELEAWRDFDSDDKIQLTYANGPTVLKDFDSIKLLNSSNASEDSIYNYALSLVGDESKINYLKFEKPKEKVIKYEETIY